MTYVFANPNCQEIVHLKTGIIQFVPSARDERDRPLGIFRTDDEAVAARLREAIGYGHTLAREVDEEEEQAQQILAKRRERDGRRVAAATQARGGAA